MKKNVARQVLKRTLNTFIFQSILRKLVAIWEENKIMFSDTSLTAQGEDFSELPWFKFYLKFYTFNVTTEVFCQCIQPYAETDVFYFCLLLQFK